MTEAVVAGHICLDFIPAFDASLRGEMDALVAPGRLTEVGAATFSTGGAVSNTGLNLHRLGIDTALMGKVGDDLFGGAVLDIVKRYKPELADGMVVVPGATTSYTIVINPPHLDRAFLHCAGANHTFSADDVRYDLLEGARLFHFGYPPIMQRFYANDGDELAEMFRRAKATGVTTALDMSMPDPQGPSGHADWRKVLEKTLPYVDIFAPSFEELLFMLDRVRFDELDARGDLLEGMTPADAQLLAEMVMAAGAKVLMLKIGERGAYLRTAFVMDAETFGRAAPPDLRAWESRELWAPCFLPTKVVGTTGTGDATIAGLLAAVLHGQSPEDALTIATAVGASSVEAADSLSGVMTFDQTMARIAAGWARQSLALDAPGWHWSAARQLWTGPLDLPG
ncbi:MAG: carbohydrate kinase family protein [Anaerolineae bacterium]|nr:carbohydrate kinase family protein [Anaerolineae bacterium]